MDCVNKVKYQDEKVLANLLACTTDIGLHITHVDKSIEVLGRTCLTTQQVVEGLEKRSQTIEQQQQLNFARLEQQQHFIFNSLQQIVVSSLRSYFEHKPGAVNGSGGLVDFDSLLTTRLQPLGSMLENMQKQFGQVPAPSVEPRTPPTDAFFKRLERGYSDMTVKREVTTYLASNSNSNETSMEDIADEAGLVAPMRRTRVRGSGDGHDALREELRSMHRSELQMFQASLLADMKKDQMLPLLGEIKKQESLLQPLSSKMEVLLSAQSASGLAALMPVQDKTKEVSAIPVLQPLPTVSGDGIGKKQSSSDLRSLGGTAPPSLQTGRSRLDTPDDLFVEETFSLAVDDKEDTHNIVLHEDSSLGAVFLCDDDVEKPPYNVESFYYKTGCPQAIARNPHFQQTTVFVVCLNAIWIGIDSDWNTKANIYDANIMFLVAAQFFVCYFFFEWFIRLIAFENKANAWKDGWFKFDTFLVSTMVLDVWILMPLLKLMVTDGKVTVPTQPLRVIRLLKLTRMARLMRAFPELVTMVKGLFRALRAIFSSLILIMLMVYIWAILLHMLLKDDEELNDTLRAQALVDFRTLPHAMWVLIIDGTLLLDGSSAVLTHLMFSKQFSVIVAGIFFTTYTLLSALLILQMLIGVLCDVVSRVEEEQRDATAIGLVKQELLHKLLEVDDGDGKITQAELFHVLGDDKSKAVLKKLGINRLFMYQLQTMLFKHSATAVPIKAALDLMLLCRSSNKATVEALAGGFCYVSGQLHELKKQLLKG